MNMKSTILIAALGLMAFGATAQNKTRSAQPSSSVLLNLGIGLSNWGVPVYGGLEAYVHPDFTLGGVVSYRRHFSDWNDYRYDFSITTISAVGNYHFNRVLNIPHNWDLYLGANLGYSIANYVRPVGAPVYDYRRVGGLAAGLQLGGRYYFSRNAGLNLEIGGGNVLSDARFGITFRL
jgi:outer membrane immunogenic protein